MLHDVTLRYTLSVVRPTLHYVTFNYITLHYITLHYITLHYITLSYTILHYIMHYIPSHYRQTDRNTDRHTCTHTHTYIHTYIHTYVHTYIPTCIHRYIRAHTWSSGFWIDWIFLGGCSHRRTFPHDLNLLRELCRLLAVRSLSLGLQITQSRSYLCFRHPQVGIICILGAPGYVGSWPK